MRTILTTLFLTALVTSCGSSDSRPAECEEIVEACHMADKGTGTIHECHENAESTWTKDQCVANKSMCQAACAAGGGGADASAGN